MAQEKSGTAAGGVSKVWLASYPPVVPAEIDPPRDTSLAAVLEESCNRYAGRIAFSSMGRDMSYADLDKASRDIAAWL